MSDYGKCPECGNELKADAPQGMCPECLMRAGLETIGADTMLEEVVETASPLDVEVFGEAQGKYTLLGEHARGGMGRVLIVHDESLGRDVALKELLPGHGVDHDGTPIEATHSKELVARFMREAKITGQLEHPSITPVHELGRRENGSLYYTMKLVRGRTLQKAISECETLEDRLKLLPHFVDLCNAIAYAHSRNVIHRDIKPANVMIGEYGETVIVDWGLAKVQDKTKESGSVELDSDAATVMGVKQDTPGSGHKTQVGELLGTPVYMSPEQAKGLPANELSDVYSLGAVLYEILTGRPPFTGKSIEEIIAHVIYDAPEAPRKITKKIEKVPSKICVKTLSKDGEDRYANAQELGDAVEGWKPYRIPRVRIGLELALLAVLIIPVIYSVVMRVFEAPIRAEISQEIRQLGEFDDSLETNTYPNLRTGDIRATEESLRRISVHWLISRESKFSSIPVAARIEFQNVLNLWGIRQRYQEIHQSILPLDDMRDDAWADAVEDLPKHATTLTFLKEIADMPPEPGELIWKHENEGDPFLRYWASVLLIDAHRAIKAGDEDQYIENIIDMIRIAEHIDDSIPRYIPYRAFFRLYREAMSDVSRRMINHELSSTALVTFAGIKNERNPASYFAEVTKVERNELYVIDPWLSGADFWNSLEINKLKTQRGVLNRSKVVLSKFHESPHIFLANLYGSEVRSAHESVPIFSRRLAGIRFPAKVFSFQLDLVTERELNRVKFAVGAFVLDHATFPESLDELVPDYLDTVPIDAFDGKAVKVYRDDNEFRVYSVGTDRADNAGKSYLEMRRDNSDGTSGFDNVVKIPISTPSNVAGV